VTDTVGQVTDFHVRISKVVRFVCLVILSAIFVVVLLDFSKHIRSYIGTYDPDHRPYELELVYHRGVWLSLIFIAIVLAYMQKFPGILTGLVTLFVCEFISLQMYPRAVGHPFSPAPPNLNERFVPHPLLQLALNPGSYGRATHTADGHRLTVNVNKSPNANLVFVYGASTTYDNGVNDSETWSSALSNLLGPDFVVENHGVQGYSTVIHLIQALFDFRNVHPKCAVYYVGGTDLLNSNYTNLKPDYSDYHLLRQSNFASEHHRLLERRSAFLSILRALSSRERKPPGIVSEEYDERLSQIYKQNIKLIAIITKSFGVKPIFVPETWNKQHMTEDYPTVVAYVKERDIPKMAAHINADLDAAASETNSVVLREVVAAKWEKADFKDYAHFTPEGSKKLAGLIAGHVAAECK
jgi:lysophospholipase L1-like esterase